MRRVYVEEMVRHLHEQGHKTRRIARMLGIGRRRVRRILECAALGYEPGAIIRRGSWLDPYRGELLVLAAAGMNAVSITREMTLLHPEVFQPGAYESVKKYLARERPAGAPEVFCRVETAPGEEAQIDFFRLWRGLVPGGQPWLFVGTLSFSRRTFTKVVRDQRVPTFLGASARCSSSSGARWRG
jgi:transposase